MTPMFVQCSSCMTEFELDPKKVPAAGVRARCSVCSAVIDVPAPRSATAPASSEPDSSSRPDTGAARGRESRWDAPNTVAAESRRDVGSSGTESVAAGPRFDRPDTPPADVPSSDAPVAASWNEPSASPAPHSGEGWSAPAGAPAAAPAAEPESGQRRPINPFLTRDPALRAKRLARALVSDIVAYHPARHAEGLRDGTLKTLFRDEIKKSYEEYVDQVGRDFAGSTTHFQDALNDVLASGKKLF